MHESRRQDNIAVLWFFNWMRSDEAKQPMEQIRRSEKVHQILYFYLSRAKNQLLLNLSWWRVFWNLFQPQFVSKVAFLLYVYFYISRLSWKLIYLEKKYFILMIVLFYLFHHSKGKNWIPPIVHYIRWIFLSDSILWRLVNFILWKWRNDQETIASHIFLFTIFISRLFNINFFLLWRKLLPKYYFILYTI